MAVISLAAAALERGARDHSDREVAVLPLRSPPAQRDARIPPKTMRDGK